MKKKKTAVILSILTGWLGIHRFYLGQPGWGIAYILLGFVSFLGIPLILGVLDAIIFATMKDEIFDLKYNRQPYERSGRRFEREYTREARVRERLDRRRKTKPRREQTTRSRRTSPSTRQRRGSSVSSSRANPYKKSGVQKFKEYDYNGAIEDFLKAIDINPNDIATHFNLACAYSLNESTAKSLHHLQTAVSLGYNNFENIRNHDALAYLRIQPEYEAFASKGFEQVISSNTNTPRNNTTQPTPDHQAELEPAPPEDNLLEQLKKLAEMRQKGLLTSEQYAVEKRRLLE